MTSEGSSVSILVAYGQAMAGELFARALRRQSRFAVVARARTAQEVVQAVRSTDVDVALIGATLAGGSLSGLDAVRQVWESRPKVKSIVLLDQPDTSLAVNAFRAGAKGVFCSSQVEFKMLYRCVDRVHAGQIWATSDVLASVFDAFAQLAPLRVVDEDGLQLLTKREVDVVRLLSEGLTNRDIAGELNLSEHTIKNYLFRIFDKLGVSSRVELLLYAARSGQQPDVAGSSRKVSGRNVRAGGRRSLPVSVRFDGQPGVVSLK